MVFTVGSAIPLRNARTPNYELGPADPVEVYVGYFLFFTKGNPIATAVREKRNGESPFQYKNRHSANK